MPVTSLTLKKSAVEGEMKMNKTSTKMNTCGGGGCSFSRSVVGTVAAGPDPSGLHRRPASLSSRRFASSRPRHSQVRKLVQNLYISCTKGWGGSYNFSSRPCRPRKIVKISEFADFRRFQPRRTKHLQQIAFARADFVICASSFFRHSEFVICHWHPNPLL